jgi:hypothetical protein
LGIFVYGYLSYTHMYFYIGVANEKGAKEAGIRGQTKYRAKRHNLTGISAGSFSDARRNFLDVRSVPEAEVNLRILNVGYRES